MRYANLILRLKVRTQDKEHFQPPEHHVHCTIKHFLNFKSNNMMSNTQVNKFTIRLALIMTPTLIMTPALITTEN